MSCVASEKCTGRKVALLAQLTKLVSWENSDLTFVENDFVHCLRVSIHLPIRYCMVDWGVDVTVSGVFSFSFYLCSVFFGSVELYSVLNNVSTTTENALIKKKKKKNLWNVVRCTLGCTTYYVICIHVVHWVQFNKNCYKVRLILNGLEVLSVHSLY